MTTLAILCSGQGLQSPRMFALTAEAPEARALFEHAATLFGGRDPRALVAQAPAGQLYGNRSGQILCTLQALAAAAALQPDWPQRRVIAGYSVGEMAAWGVAGLLDGAQALDLVALRAAAMDACTEPGDGLLFVRGLSRSRIDALCARHGAAVAIVNPGDAYIVGGAGSALDGLAAEAAAQGAHVVRLAVEVASHTPRLAGAAQSFRKTLERAEVAPALPAQLRLLSGVDGAPVIRIGAGLDKLAAQIAQTVAWAECLQACVESGASAFLELGPGRALAQMAAGAYPGIPARSLDEFNSLRGVRDWLARIGD